MLECICRFVIYIQYAINIIEENMCLNITATMEYLMATTQSYYVKSVQMPIRLAYNYVVVSCLFQCEHSF